MLELRKDKAGRMLRAVNIALAMLLAAYVGAYYSMVRPFDLTPNRIAPLYSKGEFFSGDFDFESDLKRERFFTPIHRLDRLFRPGVWTR